MGLFFMQDGFGMISIQPFLLGLKWLDVSVTLLCLSLKMNGFKFIRYFSYILLNECSISIIFVFYGIFMKK